MREDAAPGAPARSRLARGLARRAWAWSAPIACALFVLAGVSAVDDYGVTNDELTQRHLGVRTADYVLEGDTRLLAHSDLTYGVAFELPLVFAERLLGLEDTRDVYLLRHLLTHLFFAAGGLACSLLAYRLTGSRLLALFALLLFLLHPRLYAHSFFNSKDIPFLAMFMIALWLTYRAFREDTLPAFVFCGAGVAILINIRILGLMLFGAVLLMRALDFLHASGRGERLRVLAGGGLFALSAAAVLFDTWPALWRDPGLLADSVAHMARYDLAVEQLFRGERIRSDGVPWEYLPVWFAITTPPAALLLGLAGFAATARAAAARPLEALRNTDARFALLLAGCAALPPLAAIALGSTLYNGWRQMFFLYAPFCLLAVLGLRQLADAAAERTRGGRCAVYLLAGAGAAAMLASIVGIHPHQQVYFNLLVDRETPEYLRTQFTMDYWEHPNREALERLIELYPVGGIALTPAGNSHLILPREDRERLVFTGDPVFRVDNSGDAPGFPLRVLHRRTVYGNTIAFASIVDLERAGEEVRAAFLEAHRAATAGEPAAESFFDLHLEGRTLAYARSGCGVADEGRRFFLHVFPEDASALPAERRELGFEALNFDLSHRGGRVGDVCFAEVELPGYAISRIATGQFDAEGRAWEAAVPLAAPGRARAPRSAAPPGGGPAARALRARLLGSPRCRRSTADSTSTRWAASSTRRAYS